MSLTPAWAPNLHPLLVHFPITLLIAAIMVDLTNLLMPTRPAVRETATLLYCIGSLLAMAAYFSGLDAAKAMLVSPATGIALTDHFTWADRTTWFFVFFASVRLAASYIWRPTNSWIMVGMFSLAVVGVGLLVLTADRGGRLVFYHGLGVATVPIYKERPWTLPDRSHIIPEIAPRKHGS